MSDAWAEKMRAIAECETEEPPAPPIRVNWDRLTTASGGRIDWQVINGSHGLRGRRLLVIELDTDAEGRVPEAMAVLAGKERAPVV